MGSLIVKYRSLSPAARASFWYAICSILQKCIGLIVVPIYTRLMSPDEYGSYSIFQSWYVLAAIVVSLGLSNYVFQNGMTKYADDRAGFSASMLGLSTASALVWVVLFLAAPGFWCSVLGLPAPFVFILLLRCIITPAYEFWSARLRYEFRYRSVVVLTLALTVLTPIVSIPVIMMAEDRLAAALWCQIVVMLIVYAVPLVSILRKSSKFYDRKYWGFALSFNLPLIPHFLSSTLLEQADRLMIGFFCGDAQAAIYSVAYSAALTMQLVCTSINQSLIPYTYQKMAAGEGGSLRLPTRILHAAVGCCCLALSICAPEIIGFLAPLEYQEGIYVIPPVAASVMLMFLFNLFATIEYYFEETRAVMWASLTGAILNIALNYILLPQFGFVAAGYTTLACYAFFCIGHFILMRRALKIHGMQEDVYDVRGLCLLTVAFTCLILGIGLLYPFPIVRYGLIVAVCIMGLAFRRRIMEQIGRISSIRRKG